MASETLQVSVYGGLLFVYVCIVYTLIKSDIVIVHHNSSRRLAYSAVFMSENVTEHRPVECMEGPLVKSVYASAPGWGVSKYLYESSDSSATYNIVILADGAHDQARAGVSCRVAMIAEPPVIDSGTYQRFENMQFADTFDLVFTFYDAFLSRPKFREYVFGGSFVIPRSDEKWANASIDHWATDLLMQKNKRISMILSEKQSAPGHRFRHVIWAHVRNKRVDGYGRGVNGQYLQNKADGLRNYRFSIVIENGKDQGRYFSEKLIDCIAMMTIPIYWGSGDNLKRHFDMNGIMLFNTEQELYNILDSLENSAERVYQEKLLSVRHNLDRVLTDVNLMDGHQFRSITWRLMNKETGRLRCGYCPFTRD